MQLFLLPLLRCPVTGSALKLQTISSSVVDFHTGQVEIVNDGILFADDDWFYPIIGGIPRLIVESFIDYEIFLAQWLPDYQTRSIGLKEKHRELLQSVIRKNRRTKESFTNEWNLFDYEKDKTWNADRQNLLPRFLAETGETPETLNGKWILDAGCGNGLLDQLIAQSGATVIGVDFGLNVERAYYKNREQKAVFVQGDLQFPPFACQMFDIVHSSGVLHHTNNTEYSFSRIEALVKNGGKLSVWLYHPRKNFFHNTMNTVRKLTSRLPARVQYYLYLVTLFPFSFVVKRLKGNRQNKREMMIDLLDGLSPEFRWEHEPAEVSQWFRKRNYSDVRVTTTDTFGFNTIGTKNTAEHE